MCGITGILSPGPVEAGVLECMRDAMRHRGPDAEGAWFSTDRRVALGHRRLSILDLSPEANQPFLSSDGRFVITFNGEIYNYRELTAELERRGRRFRTESDTEVLLEAYRVWGSNCLGRLSGMFAFAIWDERERVLFCARDRVGEKPFYYAAFDGAFIFGSELKALTLWPGFRRRLHLPALAEYLTLGCVSDPLSIWEGCRKLEPGHWMNVHLPAGGPPRITNTVRYWDLHFEPDYRERDWGERIRSTLIEASAEMAVSDVPIGTFLSGGVDSSSVTVALKKSGHQLTGYTIGFEADRYDERPWARRVSEMYDIPLVEHQVEAEAIAPVMERLAWHFDEPFNDYSYLPTYYLCREARRDITVALSGDGGDELFAGYGKYQRVALVEAARRAVPGPLRPALALLAGGPTEKRGWRRTWFQYLAPAEAGLADMLTLGFQPHDLSAIARGSFREVVRDHTPRDVVRRHLAHAPPGEVGLINAMRYLDLKLTLGAGILTKVDRASMAVSLEARPVYLNRKMLDLAAAIPSELLADRGHSKEAVKRAVAPWLPEDLVYRRKQGFHMPLGDWLREGRAMVAGNEARGLLEELVDPAAIGELRSAHTAGTAEATARLHGVEFLQRWLGIWMGSSEAVPTSTEAVAS